ncbi:Calx-beta domain-containing protein [Cohnella rhizosphaerae]|uniref:FG-GAP-like repeat-containing protein n=1 Tax=Cohnella rhizosphaerae TaxID=1457232 RepID=A0A9X4KUG6_9BACL|nr:FG-GAP-like repeat-containing protein [Cohnella rhizosphaerae]MDG0810713.1 FG-GAP-like repeat-containing protein [Cohnella rhizosphaerae]
MDLAVSNDSDSNISVLLNNGNGTFTTSAYGSFPGPFKLVSGDFDGDADDDLAVVANGVGGNGAYVLISRGDGSFETPVLYYTGNQPIDIATGDFDGDNHLDLAVTNQWSTVSFLNGNGDGTFQAKSDLPLSGYIATGDWNGDLITDLANLSGNTIFLKTSRAEGALALSAPAYSVPEDGVSAIVTVNRTGSSYGQTKVRIKTSDITAIAGSDYTAVDATIVFNPGETTQTYSIPVADNGVHGVDRTFGVTISAPTNEATLGGQTSATVTIVEDDPVPDTTAPTIDPTKFAAVDNYSGTPDRLAGAAGAIGEPGAIVRVYRWIDADTDGVVDAGELGAAIALGTSDVDGTVPGADIGDLGPGTYKYVVSAEDAAGNESPRTAAAAVTVTLTKGLAPDVTDPTWPAGATLANTNVTRTGVRLSWPAADDDRGVDHYELKQDGGLIASPSAATLTYDVAGLTAGTSYTFEIVAVDAAGNRSAPLAATVATSPLVDPAKFSAVDNYDGTPDQLAGAVDAIGRAGATVHAYRWDDADTDGVVDAGELGAAIALGTSGADGSVAAVDLGDLAPGTYKFVVTATDGAGTESPRTAAAAVTVTLTKGTAPDVAAPVWQAGATLSVSAVTYESLRLSWPAATDDRGVDHYELTQNAGTPIILTASTLSRDIGDLAASTVYEFSIVAIDAAGNRSAALTATASTLPRPGIAQPPEASGENRLRLLTLITDAGSVSLTPAFDMNVLAYEATTTESRVTLNAEPLSPAAVLRINGQSALGKLPLAIDLAPGKNVVQIEVQAANGNIRAYDLTINRREKPPGWHLLRRYPRPLGGSGN